MGELKPCPFCGGEATFREHSTCEADVACMNCCASLKVTTAGNWEVTHDTAITAWNTRPRTEGRGEGEPVAWRSRPNGYHPSWVYSADKRRVEDWRKGGQVVEPLYASPIREPEISRPDRELAAREAFQVLHPHENWNDLDERYDARGGYHPMQIKAFEAADAILNLAPVGGRGEEGSSQSPRVSHGLHMKVVGGKLICQRKSRIVE